MNPYGMPWEIGAGGFDDLTLFVYVAIVAVWACYRLYVWGGGRP